MTERAELRSTMVEGLLVLADWFDARGDRGVQRDLLAWATRVSALEAVVEVLYDALKPLAETVGEPPTSWRDNYLLVQMGAMKHLSVADVRRALAARRLVEEGEADVRS